MKKTIYCLLWVLLPLFSSAQQKQIDSMETLLQKHPGQDTLRLNLLNSLAYDYYRYKPDLGIARANEAIALALKLKEDKKLATAYQHRGHNHSSKGEDTLALEMYDRALAIHREINNPIGVARTTYNKGLVYFGRSDFQKSTQAYLMAYDVFEREKDSALMAKMLNSIGINAMYVSDYPMALSKYLTAARIYEKMGLDDSFEYALLQSNIGLVYNKLQKYQLALAYHENALGLFGKFDQKAQMASALSNMGNVYDNLGQSEKAVEMQMLAYEINEGIGSKRGMANNLTNAGIAHASLSQFDKALENFGRTLILYEALGDLSSLGIVHNAMGETYLEMPDDRIPMEDGLHRAMAHFEKALPLAQQVGSLENQGEVMENMARTYMKMGRYKEAFETRNAALILRDSIRNSEKRVEMTRLEMQYEFDKKEALTETEHEREQLLAQSEIQKQKFIRNSSILGGGSLVLATLGGLFLYKRRRDAVTQQQKAEFERVVAETELKALRSQMNPHFIFNSLNSIGDYYANNDKEAANAYLSKFAKLMRLTLEYSERKEITLEEDLKLLELYLEVESKRLIDKFTYEIKVDPTMDPENVLVPPMILQPFVENSIWHGISKKKGKGRIVIEIKKEGDMIVCSVDDDGIGRQASHREKRETKSMGMKIIESRVNILNRQKNTKGDISIMDKANDGGLRIEVKLPLELEFRP